MITIMTMTMTMTMTILFIQLHDDDDDDDNDNDNDNNNNDNNNTLFAFFDCVSDTNDSILRLLLSIGWCLSMSMCDTRKYIHHRRLTLPTTITWPCISLDNDKATHLLAFRWKQ